MTRLECHAYVAHKHRTARAVERGYGQGQPAAVGDGSHVSLRFSEHVFGCQLRFSEALRAKGVKVSRRFAGAKTDLPATSYCVLRGGVYGGY